MHGKLNVSLVLSFTHICYKFHFISTIKINCICEFNIELTEFITDFLSWGSQIKIYILCCIYYIFQTWYESYNIDNDCIVIHIQNKMIHNKSNQSQSLTSNWYPCSYDFIFAFQSIIWCTFGCCVASSFS